MCLLSNAGLKKCSSQYSDARLTFDLICYFQISNFDLGFQNEFSDTPVTLVPQPQAAQGPPPVQQPQAVPGHPPLAQPQTAPEAPPSVVQPQTVQDPTPPSVAQPQAVKDLPPVPQPQTKNIVPASTAATSSERLDSRHNRPKPKRFVDGF